MRCPLSRPGQLRIEVESDLLGEHERTKFVKLCDFRGAAHISGRARALHAKIVSRMQKLLTLISLSLLGVQAKTTGNGKDGEARFANAG